LPSYETGRLAGLGRPITGIKAQQAAWPGSDNEFPVYYRWNFRTGQNFDFEYLVKQLEPRVMDERVGIRPMDCSRPAFVQADNPNEVAPPSPQVMLLEGAMKAPSAKPTDFPPQDIPQPFFEQVEKLVNLNRFQLENPEQDPYVSVPYYGMYHAMKNNPDLPGKKEVPAFKPDASTWYNELNQDPRWRVPAGFGVRVVQENQEKFMDRAWKQLSEVLEANRKMRFAQFTATVSTYMFRKTVEKRLPEDLLGFTSALSSRILSGSQTVKVVMEESILPKAVFEGSFRRLTRNKSTLSKGLTIANSIQQTTGLLTQMNKVDGLTTAAKPTFKTLDKLRSVTQFEAPASIDNLTVWSKQSNLDENFAYNIPSHKGGLPKVNFWKAAFDPKIFKLAIDPSLITPAAGVGTVVLDSTIDRPVVINPAVTRSVLVNPRITTADTTTIRTDAIRTDAIRVDTTRVDTTVDTNRVDAIRGDVIRKPPLLATSDLAINRVDINKHNQQINQAFTEASIRYQYRDTAVQAPVLQTAILQAQIKNTIQPAYAYKRLVDARVKWPSGIFKPQQEDFLPAMAYPDIPEPAYKYLVDIDKELLLPNLHLIPENTLSLLRTNQKFIESYLMGLNYEMGKELLWREYPTDMRGSYFRQFWDVRGFVTPDTTPKDADALKDIQPIHTWSATSLLGKHNARDAQGDAEQLVFVIRGDLLKKFPNTVIYAQKAIAEREKKVIRRDLAPAQFKTEVRFPLYQAEILPDIKLLGFDLTIEEAAGLKTTDGFTDKLGWFFIIAQVPGEPEFGMDVNFEPNVPGQFTWNDLSWENFGNQPVTFVRADVAPNKTDSKPETPKWGRTSADMASILFQKPVMVAVHASEMLDVKIPDPVDKKKLITLISHVTEHMIIR
jgi:hypothetical protein